MRDPGSGDRRRWASAAACVLVTTSLAVTILYSLGSLSVRHVQDVATIVMRKPADAPDYILENITSYQPYPDNIDVADVIYQPPYPVGANASAPYLGIPTRILTPILRYYNHLDTRQPQRPERPGSGEDVVFLTAGSRDHFNESIAALRSIQKCFPQSLIIYYDLGLTGMQLQRLKTVCAVEVRTFPASEYPVYVRLVEEKRWKPIIIHQVLSEHPLVFWIDTSVRFYCGERNTTFHAGFANFWNKSVAMVRDAGVVMFSEAYHTNYQVIHPNTYRYIPTDVVAMTRTWQYESGCVLYLGSHRAMMSHVMKWWVLCALHPYCMHPKAVAPAAHDQFPRWHECALAGGGAVYAGCHRQDQSTLNTLLLNLYDFHSDRYLNLQRTHDDEPGDRGYVRIRREPGHWNQLALCQTGTPRKNSMEFANPREK